MRHRPETVGIDESTVRPTRRGLLWALFAGIAVIAISSVALATATSGYVYKLSVNVPSYGWTDGCIKSTIADVADNKAYTRTAVNFNKCGSPVQSLPSGYLGARADGYRDGAYCGTTDYYYNSSSTYVFGVGSHLCSNPSGTQTFYTQARGRLWNGSGYSYLGSQASPNQNY